MAMVLTNSGPITVTNSSGLFGASAENFNITRAPIIDSFLPISGRPPAQVRIYGVNLSNGPTILRIGGVNAPFVVVGQNGLNVFCFGIFLTVLGHAAVVEMNPAFAPQIVVTVGGILAQVAVAYYLDWLKGRGRAAAQGGSATV